jgi:hypothetical protein
MTTPTTAPHADATLPDSACTDAAPPTAAAVASAKAAIAPPGRPASLPPEIGGTQGPEPTRYGDWQHKGRVTDF